MDLASDSAWSRLQQRRHHLASVCLCLAQLPLLCVSSIHTWTLPQDGKVAGNPILLLFRFMSWEKVKDPLKSPRICCGPCESSAPSPSAESKESGVLLDLQKWVLSKQLDWEGGRGSLYKESGWAFKREWMGDGKNNTRLTMRVYSLPFRYLEFRAGISKPFLKRARS